MCEPRCQSSKFTDEKAGRLTSWGHFRATVSVLKAHRREGQVTHILRTFSRHVVSHPSSLTRRPNDSQAEDICEPHCQSSKLRREGRVTHILSTFSGHVVSHPSSQKRRPSDSLPEDIFEPQCQSSKFTDEKAKRLTA
jgi:hypothetical protein